MAWYKRRGYHHGNLREALVKAALDLIGKHGIGGVTFAEAARAAGVSPAAPYRHFRDRDALLAEAALQGYARFAAMLSAGWNQGRPDAITAFENVGRAYLAFARTEPAYYAVMFESGVPPDATPELQEAADGAFAILRGATEDVCARLPKDQRPPALMMSLHIWALSHGIAALFGRGDSGRRKLPMPPEQLLEAGVLVYLRGLGLGAEWKEKGKG